MRLILISLILVYVVNKPNKLISTASPFKSIVIEQATQRKQAFDSLYNVTIEYIKVHEGFAGGKVYVCPGGYRTIGYGHLIKPGEYFTSLSKKQADSLLRIDFNEALACIEIPLSYNKRLAIAHFVFTRGIGTFNKSKLRECIISSQPIDIQIMRYCYYKDRTGNYIYSTNSYKMRKFELQLWKKK